jgi:hypothetical protein
MVMHVLMFSSFWRVLSSSEWSDSNGLNRHSPFLSFRCKEKNKYKHEREREIKREGMRERENSHGTSFKARLSPRELEHGRGSFKSPREGRKNTKKKLERENLPRVPHSAHVCVLSPRQLGIVARM